MKLIQPKFEILEQGSKLSKVLKQIEICGRTCYKSENNIREESAPKFVDMLINRGHTAMLEAGTIYLILSMTNREVYFKYCNQKYSKAVSTGEAEKGTWKGVVCTNYRVLLENEWLGDLQYLGEPNWEDISYNNPFGDTLQSIRRITVKFTTQIAITREMNRHRVNSIAEQSTRYCPYDKDKFGHEISINLPSFIPKEETEARCDNLCISELYENCYHEEVDNPIDYWLFANRVCEYCYMNLIRLGWKAEQARTVLPLDTNTEICHTATISQWQHFFKLRCDKTAHVDIKKLIIPLQEEFKNRGWI